LVEQANPRPQSIQEVNAYLTKWVQDVTRGASVSLEPPGVPSLETDVSLYLFEILRDPPLRGPKRPPLQLLLRYLVTIWGTDQTTMHHILNQLIFAAMASPAFEVEDNPIPAALWSTFHTLPRPSFILRYPLRVEQHDLSLPLVREAQLVPSFSRTTLHGRLLIPGAGPAGEAMSLAGARVEIPSLQRTATSDSSGYFRLDNVLPGASGTITLVVKAKGHTFRKAISETGSARAPVTLEVPLPIARLNGHVYDRAGKPLAGVRIELTDQRQFVYTRPDGSFMFDGLPTNLDMSQIKARSAGKAIRVKVKAGLVSLTQTGAGPLSEPIVIQFIS
jgi:hypothetical protein